MFFEKLQGMTAVIPPFVAAAEILQGEVAMGVFVSEVPFIAPAASHERATESVLPAVDVGITGIIVRTNCIRGVSRFITGYGPGLACGDGFVYVSLDL